MRIPIGIVQLRWGRRLCLGLTIKLSPSTIEPLKGPHFGVYGPKAKCVQHPSTYSSSVQVASSFAPKRSRPWCAAFTCVHSRFSRAGKATVALALCQPRH